LVPCSLNKIERFADWFVRQMRKYGRKTAPGTGQNHVGLAALGHESFARPDGVLDEHSSTGATVTVTSAICIPRELARLDRFAY